MPDLRLQSSCIARRRLIPRAGNTKPLLAADLPDPAGRSSRSNTTPSTNFSATVDMVPALGSTEKNHITEYKDVRAYIRFRKPADIRIIGLMPVVRSTSVRHGFQWRRFQALHPVQGPFHRRPQCHRAAFAQQAGESPPAAFPGCPDGSAHRHQRRQSRCSRISPTRTTPTTSSTRCANCRTVTLQLEPHHLVQPHGPAAWPAR